MQLIEQLSKSLPPAFGRTAVNSLLPGIINAKTLANLDSSGDGPPRYRKGRKIFYSRDSFLAWLEKRIQEVE